MYRSGLFDLRHGSARSAWDRLSSACDDFHRLGMTAEAIAAHRAMAEAALQLKRPSDAISEQYKAYGALLRIAAPERHPVTVGKWRVFRTRAYARYPALRIFYTCDEAAVCLLGVEPWDELVE